MSATLTFLGVIPGALQHDVMRRRPGIQDHHVGGVVLDPGSPLRSGRDDRGSV